MDTQMKKGLLDYCALASLVVSPSYGYQILKNIGDCIELTESTLYPVLRRLESAGCLETFTQEWGGRLRKYYKITDEGLRRLGQFSSERSEIERIYNYIDRCIEDTRADT